MGGDDRRTLLSNCNIICYFNYNSIILAGQPISNWDRCLAGYYYRPEIGKKKKNIVGYCARLRDLFKEKFKKQQLRTQHVYTKIKYKTKKQFHRNIYGMDATLKYLLFKYGAHNKHLWGG